MSTKTGLKPAFMTEYTVEMQVIAGNITSPLFLSKLFKAKKIEGSKSSGAGDALFSGFLYAICKGKTSFEAAEFGISLAEKTLEISGPVNPEVSELGKTLR